MAGCARWTTAMTQFFMICISPLLFSWLYELYTFQVFILHSLLSFMLRLPAVIGRYYCCFSSVLEVTVPASFAWLCCRFCVLAGYQSKHKANGTNETVTPHNLYYSEGEISASNAYVYLAFVNNLSQIVSSIASFVVDTTHTVSHLRICSFVLWYVI